MHGNFHRNVENKTDWEKTWLWMTKADLQPETEPLICAAWEQVLRTNNIKYRLDRMSESVNFRICRENSEPVWHITGLCMSLTQKDCKRRHDNIATIFHGTACNKYTLDSAENWYNINPKLSSKIIMQS